MQKLTDLIRKLEEKPKLKGLVQFAKFSIVGFINTVIDLGVYYICLKLFDWHYQIANLMGFITSVTNAYICSNKFVFNDGRHHTLKEHVTTYLKTVAGYGGTCVLSIALLWMWVEKVGMSEDYAKIINLFITVPLNYIIVKFWSFKRSK